MAILTTSNKTTKIDSRAVDPILKPVPSHPKFNPQPPSTACSIATRSQNTRQVKGSTQTVGIRDISREWLNKEVIESHLRASGRPGKLSPFISVFTDEDCAKQRAEKQKYFGDKGVFLAHITPFKLSGATVTLALPHKTAHLPFWRTPGGKTFIRVEDAREHLGVAPCYGMRSEWLVIGHIPASIITQATSYK